MVEEKNILDAHNVEEIFMKCLFEKDELDADRNIPKDAVKVEGIQRLFCFHPGRLVENKDKIKNFINQLPKNFEQGQTFLNMCMTESGYQWGEHRNCEQLLVMGIGIGSMDYVMPSREMWAALPGGMPYVFVKGDAS